MYRHFRLAIKQNSKVEQTQFLHLMQGQVHLDVLVQLLQCPQDFFIKINTLTVYCLFLCLVLSYHIHISSEPVHTVGIERGPLRVYVPGPHTT